ncbi:mitochondrial 37S ribosomal protein mS35 [Aspergillus saccharolyticus JOP 1030-1]|uniref:Putative 37S ribosomal protein Rsm24 n=1 Tax=Aspergillus saccharolyticus JOP 1030-1 TaxID=1450539 RepID=A0A318ZS53_9EURO|nr:putative 37S ribosomal protein Rsm24 [Aspergillus saccharolyticus JOP 1030-1]PYH46780.1 putative 37S ribosomal protein Rsm24 [Aspergillus saccharolyticus JOP 1030-1]
MASVARSLGRSAFSMAQRGPIVTSYRSFSATPLSFLPDEPAVPETPAQPDIPTIKEYSPETLDPQTRSMYDLMSPEERQAFDAANKRLVSEFNDPEKRKSRVAQLEKKVADLEKRDPWTLGSDFQKKKLDFWADEEIDPMGMVPDMDDDFNDDDITSMAYAELEEHREIREYARIAAWDMPSLSKLAKPFTLPPETHILRFRYTTYMGEEHPAQHKVVVELASRDLTPKYLTEAQRQTFLKLVGVRYNPQTDIVRMSCEKFQYRAQNKRYLGDVIQALIKEAKEGDSFADIPLDLRHHKPKNHLRFPDEWVMTPQRRRELDGKRAAQKARQIEQSDVVDGTSIITEAVRTLPAFNPALRLPGKDDKAGAKVGAKVGVRVGARAQPQRRLR